MFLKHSSFCVHLDYPKIVVSPAAAVILFVCFAFGGVLGRGGAGVGVGCGDVRGFRGIEVCVCVWGGGGGAVCVCVCEWGGGGGGGGRHGGAGVEGSG